MTIILGGPGTTGLSTNDMAAAVSDAGPVLRIDGAGALSEGETARLQAEIDAALGLAEQFIGRVLIDRAFTARLWAGGEWQRLGIVPVSAINSVIGIAEDGTQAILPVEDYAIDIAPDGEGWVRLIRGANLIRFDVSGRAGMAAQWAMLAPTIAQGIVRLATYRFLERDKEGAVPASVTALWRPWRRLASTGAGARV